MAEDDRRHEENSLLSPRTATHPRGNQSETYLVCSQNRIGWLKSNVSAGTTQAAPIRNGFTRLRGCALVHVVGESESDEQCADERFRHSCHPITHDGKDGPVAHDPSLSSLAPGIAVMEPAQPLFADQRRLLRGPRFDRPRIGCVLAEAVVDTILVKVGDVIAEKSPQMLFA